MKTEHKDQQLSAFVDDELAGADVEDLYRDLQDDAALRSELAEIQGLKNLIRHAYEDVAPEPVAAPRRRPIAWRTTASAATLLLCVVAGWLAHSLLSPMDAPALAAPTVAAAADRVVVHVDKSDARSWKTALDTVEQLLNADGGHNTKVELLTNAGGIDLLRRGTSPYAARIESLAQRYPNLAFIACATGMQRLQEQGVDVQLLAPAQTAPSALEHVVERLTSGWSYRKI